MSNRRKKRSQNLQRGKELLQAPAERFVSNELIQLVMQRLPGTSHTEALELQLQLEKLIFEDAAVLERPDLTEYLSRMRERVRARDKAEIAYETDREKFVDEVYERALKQVDKTGDKRDREIAKGTKMYEEARKAANANRRTKELQFAWELEHGPKEEIFVTGHFENKTIDGRAVPMLAPDELYIINKRFVFPPGKHLVPRVVAQAYNRMLLYRQRTELVERAMEPNNRGAYPEAGEVTRAIAEASKIYGDA